MFRKKYIWPLLYGILLFSFTTYVLLDTFVIARVYTQVPSGESSVEITDSSGEGNANIHGQQIDSVQPETDSIISPEETDTPVITSDFYSDANLTISITAYREYDTTIYVADIQVSSAEYLKTAFAQDIFGKNITDKTSNIAKDHGAILAINGDYYGVQETGYVLRNGILYRKTASTNQEDLIIFEDGTFQIITEEAISADDLLAAGARQILSFGPALLMNGSIAVTEDEEVGKAKASNPRTAIAILDDLHYLFIVSDGRTNESEGLSLYELAEFIQSLGGVTAYNLDGGGSSTMYFNGEIINNPTTNGRAIKERSVSDIVYIGY